MSATREAYCTASAPTLYLALELGWGKWHLAFTIGLGQKARRVALTARDLTGLRAALVKARQRFGLSDQTPVVSCYEAGRDGFWLHRWLLAEGIQNLVVDSASIEVNRRKRRAKSDRLDAEKLLLLLIRWHLGERKAWNVVHAPSPQQEDERQLHRELESLKHEQTQHVCRIKGLLAGLGLESPTVNSRFLERLKLLRQWDGQPLPAGLHQRLMREYARWELVHTQIRDLERERARAIRDESISGVDRIRRLFDLRGIGDGSAWLLVREFFGWRKLRNRREVAALAGLAPTPYNSGGSEREQGISKAGNRRVRTQLTELAWLWLQYQPDSALSQWYRKRFSEGNIRMRKIGITALARKLLVALWKYVEFGELPEGAVLSDWREKLAFQSRHRKSG